MDIFNHMINAPYRVRPPKAQNTLNSRVFFGRLLNKGKIVLKLRNLFLHDN